MINLEWLRTFSAIFECSNITEASKLLHMTQPGVSKHLAALENHIGKKLFDRTTRTVIPTEYGKFLYTQITSPLKELEKVEYYSGNRTKKERSAIIIGCTSDFFRKELLSVIYQLDMYIVTCFGGQKELIESLEHDKIQLLIGTKKYSRYPHQFTMLKEENLVLVASGDTTIPGDMLSEKKKLIKWLRKQIWFAYDNDLKDVNEYWEINFNQKSKIIPRYILPSYVDILEALKANQGFSVLPKSICEKALEEGIIQIPFPSLEHVKQKLFCSHKMKNERLKEIKLFRKKMGY